jgi:hypothetical protein
MLYERFLARQSQPQSKEQESRALSAYRYGNGAAFGTSSERRNVTGCDYASCAHFSGSALGNSVQLSIDFRKHEARHV